MSKQNVIKFNFDVDLDYSAARYGYLLDTLGHPVLHLTLMTSAEHEFDTGHSLDMTVSKTDRNK